MEDQDDEYTQGYIPTNGDYDKENLSASAVLQTVLRYPCDLCEKTFTKQHHMNRHMLLHKGVRYACEKCGKSYSRHDKAKKHEIKCDFNPNEPCVLSCDICSLKFNDQDKFDQHKKKCSLYTFECGLCQKSFPDTDSLERHRKNNHSFEYTESEKYFLYNKEKFMKGEKAFSCSICGLDFNTKPSVRRHIVLLHLDKSKIKTHESLTCEICQHTFSTKASFKRHMIRKHTELSSDNPKQIKTQERPSCEICQHTFSSKKHLKRHMISKHTELSSDNPKLKESKYPCDICGKVFNRNTHLSRHKKLHTSHNDKHPCKKCGKSFSRRDKAVKHESICNFVCEGTPYSCTGCGHLFVNSDELTNHEKRCGDLKLKCEKCFVRFSKIESFNRHKINDCNIEKYIVYDNEKNLKGDKSFSCLTCGSWFQKRSTLKHHILRIHLHIDNDQPKRISCNLCDKKFYKRHKLEKHLAETHSKLSTSEINDGEGEEENVFDSESDSEDEGDLNNYTTEDQSSGNDENDKSNILSDKENEEKSTDDIENVLEHSFDGSNKVVEHTPDDDKLFLEETAVKEEVEQVNDDVEQVADSSPFKTTHDIKVSPVKSATCEYFKSFTTIENELINVESSEILSESPTRIEEGYSCDDCERSFVSHAQLNRHMISHVESNDYSEDYTPDIAAKIKSYKMYSCDECVKTFSRKDNLKRHINDVHKLKSLITGPNLSALKNEQTNISIDMISDSPIRIDSCYPCDDIDMPLVDHTELNKHIQSGIQSKDLSEEYSLERGVTMNPKKEYSCDECPKIFSRKDRLKHHKEKVHKTTATSNSLKKETNDKKCDVCNKEFSRKQHLRRHKLTHSNIKEFACNFCSASFTRKDKKNEHESKVHFKTSADNIKDELIEDGWKEEEHNNLPEDNISYGITIKNELDADEVEPCRVDILNGDEVKSCRVDILNGDEVKSCRVDILNGDEVNPCIVRPCLVNINKLKIKKLDVMSWDLNSITSHVIGPKPSDAKAMVDNIEDSSEGRVVATKKCKCGQKSKNECLCTICDMCGASFFLAAHFKSHMIDHVKNQMNHDVVQMNLDQQNIQALGTIVDVDETPDDDSQQIKVEEINFDNYDPLSL